MPSESVIMPHVPTPITATTRPRLGFSIEALVGDDKSTSAISPPLSIGTTKLPDSPVPADNTQFLFSPKDLLYAREQHIKEQVLRTHLFREQLTREQISREITREQITRELNREQILREQQRIILREDPNSRDIREFENRLLPSPGTPVRNGSPSSLYEEDVKKSSPTLPSSPPIQPTTALPQVFPGLPFGPHILSMNNNSLLPPQLGVSPLLSAHPPLLGHNIGHPLGTPLPPSHCQREYPLYPWLFSARQSRLFPPGFAGPEFPTFLLPFRKPKRIRTAFSPNQLLKLEEAFEKNQYVVGAERKQLAIGLSLSETQVKVWFQNRRTKHKRQQQEGDEGPEGGNKEERNTRMEDEDDLILEHDEDEELDVENEAIGH